jgi:protein-S-isoprenylcysteine O-methyltransferase Ste14
MGGVQMARIEESVEIKRPADKVFAYVTDTHPFNIAATKPSETFTTGMYRYSRHPISLGTLLPMIGAGIASASWLFLPLSVILMVISHFLAITEESATTKKFGDAYRKYMARTPRWIGIPK